MAEVCGIALGNYQATVAVFKNGRAEVLANASGERATPMLVSYVDSGMLVGVPAKQAYYRNADCTAQAILSVLMSGTNGGERAGQDVSDKRTKKVEIRDGRAGYSLCRSQGGTFFVPADSVLEEVFKTLADTARQCVTSLPMPVVLAVSPSWPLMLVETLRKCATATGFRVLSTASEPALSAMAYGVSAEDDTCDGHILIFDLGWQTLDISLLYSSQGFMRTIYSGTFPGLGGASLDDALVSLLKEEYRRVFLAEFCGSQRALLKMAAAAELAKHTLSSQHSASVCIESLHNGMDFQCSVSRGRFEGLCLLQFKSFFQPIWGVLEACCLTNKDVSKVVFTGGCSKIPYLHQMMREQFASAKVLHSVDSAAAVGAAMQGLVAQRFSQLPDPLPCRLPTLASDLWILLDQCTKPISELLLPSGSPLPCFKSLTLFPKPVPSVKAVSLQLREGPERAIAQVSIPCLPTPRHDSLHLRIGFSWQSADGNQKIELCVKEMWSGWSESSEIKSCGTIART